MASASSAATDAAVDAATDKLANASVADESTTATAADGDGPDMTKTHPLQYRWTMWYNPKQQRTGGEWKSNVQSISSFDTVEGFWCLYNNLVPPTRLQLGSNYHLFKDGIMPEWEDKANATGGKWVFTLSHDRERIDQMWLYTLLALIGESFEFSSQICGVVVSPRKKECRIALWTTCADSQHEAAVRSIGAAFKATLGVTDHPIGYQLHNDALKHECSFRNASRFQV